jgi:hypothetical protein
MHIWNIPRVLEKLLVIRRGTYDQYATIGENWHVIEKEMFIKTARKLPAREAYVLSPVVN